MQNYSIKLLLFFTLLGFALTGCVKEVKQDAPVIPAEKLVLDTPASDRDGDCFTCDPWKTIKVTFLELPETEEGYVVGGAIVSHCDDLPSAEQCGHFIEHFNLGGPNPTGDSMPFYSGTQPKDLVIVFGGWPSCADEDWTVRLKVVFDTPIPTTRYITCRKPVGTDTGYARINAPNCDGYIFPFGCDVVYPNPVDSE